MSYEGLPVQSDPDMIILHHSGNKVDTPEGIIEYHSNKWAGCGYNWMVYRGKVYVGRPTKFVGAHSKGENDGSIGVCLVGNYMHKAPSDGNLLELIRWLAHVCFHDGIDPSNIVAHRDVGATDCPGDALYNLLPYIREEVKILLKGEQDAQIHKS